MTGIGDLAGPESILGPVGLMGNPDEESKKGDKDKEEEENCPRTAERSTSLAPAGAIPP